MRIEVQLLHVYNMFALHSISCNTLLVFNYRARRSFLKGGGWRQNYTVFLKASKQNLISTMIKMRKGGGGGPDPALDQFKPIK